MTKNRKAELAAASCQDVLSELLELDCRERRLQVCFAFDADHDSVPEFRRLRIADSVAQDFCAIAEAAVEDKRKRFNRGDFALRPYDAGSKLDPHEVEHVEASANATVRELIESLSDIDSLEALQSDDEMVSALRFYVIALLAEGDGDHAFFFRIANPKMELSRSRLFGLFLAGEEFDRFREPMLLFDRFVDCIYYKGWLFVLNKNNFQRIFRYFEAVRAVARQTLETIKNSVPISNFDEFQQACEGHLLMLSKLKNIASKPYLSQIGMPNIKQVIQAHNLTVQIVTVEGKEQLVFDRSDVWGILRLLDDDYLDSLMTGNRYEVNSKRQRP